MWAERMGRVGIWTGQLDTQPGAEAERSAAELEAMGRVTAQRDLLSIPAVLASETQNS